MKKKYNFKSYDEIDKINKDYILSVSDCKNITDIPLEGINDFLNHQEEWWRDQKEKEEPPEFWEHYCTREETIMGMEKGSPCNWCGLTEEELFDSLEDSSNANSIF